MAVRVSIDAIEPLQAFKESISGPAVNQVRLVCAELATWPGSECSSQCAADISGHSHGHFLTVFAKIGSGGGRRVFYVHFH